ncbi:protein FAM200C-like [Wyeomyia smithii]|uniref:protein FAM200C-like n=1 Tax=Wyeomyia smithii TaxID=174621 RepID=UPI0024680F1D|nr:protein FAM200C-like [Wyeomyia smithii]
MEKKRQNSEDYIKYGFTDLTINGINKPQCVLCNVVLSVEAMKPSKLKRHLVTHHAEHSAKDMSFFRRYEAGIKRRRLNSSGTIQLQSNAVLQASYETAFEIARNKKPHTIGETLINPRC